MSEHSQVPAPLTDAFKAISLPDKCRPERQAVIELWQRAVNEAHVIALGIAYLPSESQSGGRGELHVVALVDGQPNFDIAARGILDAEFDILMRGKRSGHFDHSLLLSALSVESLPVQSETEKRPLLTLDERFSDHMVRLIFNEDESSLPARVVELPKAA
jgi:hypothetical protein